MSNRAGSVTGTYSVVCSYGTRNFSPVEALKTTKMEKAMSLILFFF